MNPPRPGWLPDARQELLLRACLLPEDRALAAWEEWRSGLDLDRLDGGSYRLLPLLHRNLARLGVDDPLVNTFGGVRRMTWYRNQILVDRALPLLDAFNREGIETGLLKGAALALLHYRDVGLRPMADLDLLVPAARAGDAVRITFDAGWKPVPTPLKAFGEGSRLARTGWGPGPRGREGFTAAYFGARHSHGFHGPRGGSVDLHWRLLAGTPPGEQDEDFPGGSVPAPLRGVPTLALDAADQLLHVCAHGARWDPVHPVRWAADAATVIDASGEGLDWDRLAARARRQGLTLPVSVALGFLSARLGLPVPPRVLEELRRQPANLPERLKHRAASHPPGILDGLLELDHLRRCHRSMKSTGVLRSTERNFPGFLTHVLGMDRVAQVPVYACLEVARRAWVRRPRFLGGDRGRCSRGDQPVTRPALTRAEREKVL